MKHTDAGCGKGHACDRAPKCAPGTCQHAMECRMRIPEHPRLAMHGLFCGSWMTLESVCWCMMVLDLRLRSKSRRRESAQHAHVMALSTSRSFACVCKVYGHMPDQETGETHRHITMCVVACPRIGSALRVHQDVQGGSAGRTSYMRQSLFSLSFLKVCLRCGNPRSKAYSNNLS